MKQTIRVPHKISLYQPKILSLVRNYRQKISLPKNTSRPTDNENESTHFWVKVCCYKCLKCHCIESTVKTAFMSFALKNYFVPNYRISLSDCCGSFTIKSVSYIVILTYCQAIFLLSLALSGSASITRWFKNILIKEDISIEIRVFVLFNVSLYDSRFFKCLYFIRSFQNSPQPSISHLLWDRFLVIW